ncbi:MAG: methylene-tetrahydromethanopterin dehydrogenase N-terminal domain-containing protein [Geminicoccaceae bacterium]
MSSAKSIPHFVTPLKNVSPFDVNMATDAGFDVIVPYTDVDLKEVAGLVQDAIFSRAPENGAHTVLIGGRKPILAIDMLDAARKAMVPPYFEISVMADPRAPSRPPPG